MSREHVSVHSSNIILIRGSVKNCAPGEMTRFNLTFNSCWFVTQDHVFPFLDNLFNKSMGVEYVLGTVFVGEVLSALI